MLMYLSGIYLVESEEICVPGVVFMDMPVFMGVER